MTAFDGKSEGNFNVSFLCNSNYHMEKYGLLNKVGVKTQPQLFVFILDILSNPCFSTIMSWEGSNGQFVIKRPDTVARLWGERNCRRNMTYQKFCRALRYYYHKEVLTKIRGRKFTYKFDLYELQRRYGFKRIPLPVTRESTDTLNFPLPTTRVCATDVFPAIATHAFTTGTHASDLFPATGVHAVAKDVSPGTAAHAANGFLANSPMMIPTPQENQWMSFSLFY